MTEYLDPYRLWNFIDWQEESSKLTVADARSIFRSLAKAVAHCHAQGIIVRDLSPSNLLVKKRYTTATPTTPIMSNVSASEKKSISSKKQHHLLHRTSHYLMGNYNTHSQSHHSLNNNSPHLDLDIDCMMEPFEVKIVDLSLAVMVNNEQDAFHDDVHGKGNSDGMQCDLSLLPYTAPEVLFSNGHHEQQDKQPVYSQASDIWSLGVLLFVMLAGRVPFQSSCASSSFSSEKAREKILLDNIRCVEFDFDDAIWQAEDDLAIVGAKQLISQALQGSVSRRINMSQLLNHPWLQ